MKLIKSFLYWLFVAGIIWYAAAVFLPTKGITLPAIGINNYGTGTADQLPYVPQADSKTYGTSITITPIAEGQDSFPLRPGQPFIETELQRMWNTKINVVFVKSPCDLPVKKDHYVGCVLPSMPTTIFYSNTLKKAADPMVSAMAAHELAHVYQHKVDPDFLQYNAAVAKAFPNTTKPHEELADCMAVYRTGLSTNAYIKTCNQTQLQVAETVWEGHVPNLSK